MKNFTRLLSLLLCLALLAGCSCQHDWKDASCEDPETCAECSETQGDPLGHTWEDATLEKPKTCSECGETKGDPLSILDIYPRDTPRHADGAFLFTHQEYALLLNEELAAEGFHVEFSEISEDYAYYDFYQNGTLRTDLKLSVNFDPTNDRALYIHTMYVGGSLSDSAFDELMRLFDIAFLTGETPTIALEADYLIENTWDASSNGNTMYIGDYRGIGYTYYIQNGVLGFMITVDE